MDESYTLPSDKIDMFHQVLVVGGGSAGIAVTASLLHRVSDLDIAIVEPSETHYYQPGWTMVGGGVFEAEQTAKAMSSLIPNKAKWLKNSVKSFFPKQNKVMLDDGKIIQYEQLIVCPGLQLDWDKIEGLSETLGKNGVSSNYRFDLAPYTWQQITSLNVGKAIFTQPTMPIKCAGAPQKAMYLACDYWRRHHCLSEIQTDFFNAGAVLFGVADFVPALMEYVKKYHINLNFEQELISVNGDDKTATFQFKQDDEVKTQTREFDFLHVVPPQSAPNFIKSSPLADSDGWLDVDKFTLRHKVFENVFGLGDVTNTPNAKTAAAVRVQAPIVAQNLLIARGELAEEAQYNGYGGCPLTVERGKIVLAEFGYDGKRLNTLPLWLIDGTKPSSIAWMMKETLLPQLYWEAMLKGREWLTHPSEPVN